MGGASDDLLSLDFSLDLAIYAIFTLAITTATLWRVAWKSYKRERTVKLLLTKAAVRLVREILVMKVRFDVEARASWFEYSTAQSRDQHRYRYNNVMYCMQHRGGEGRACTVLY